jgi:hypothetical protein
VLENPGNLPFMGPLVGGISVYTENVNAVGSYAFRLIAKDVIGNELNSLLFTVQLDCQVRVITVAYGASLKVIKQRVSAG